MNTELVKRFIVEQRAMGKSFANIGRELGRSENAVRMTFNRIMKDSGLRGSTDSGENTDRTAHENKCKYCGRELIKTPRGAKRMFCSDKCRNAWCNEKKRHTPNTLVCEYCGKGFVAFGNPHKRFCSRKCYADFHRELRQGVSSSGQYMEVLHG